MGHCAPPRFCLFLTKDRGRSETMSLRCPPPALNHLSSSSPAFQGRVAQRKVPAEEISPVTFRAFPRYAGVTGNAGIIEEFLLPDRAFPVTLALLLY